MRPSSYCKREERRGARHTQLVLAHGVNAAVEDRVGVREKPVQPFCERVTRRRDKLPAAMDARDVERDVKEHVHMRGHDDREETARR